MGKLLTPKEQTTANNAMHAVAPTSCEEHCATPKLRLEYLDAIAGNVPYMRVTDSSMSMLTRAGVGQPISAQSRATPMRANRATQYRREQSLSLFPSVIHGRFEKSTAKPHQNLLQEVSF